MKYIIFTCILFFLAPGVMAYGTPGIIFISHVYQDQLMYYDETKGNLVSYNTQTQNQQPLTQISPNEQTLYQKATQDRNLFSQEETSQAPLRQIYFNKTLDKALIYGNNVPFDSYPFFNPNSQADRLWWIYDLETSEATPLDDNLTAVNWYSEDEIIYVFNDSEVSVAPASNPSDFEVLTVTVGNSVDPSKPIQANDRHQLIPFEDGYFIGQEGNFSFHSTSGTAQALPSQDRFVIYTQEEIQVMNWQGDVISTITDIDPIQKALVIDSNTIAVLFQDGTTETYTPEGTSQPLSISEDAIENIFYSNADTPHILTISQSDTLYLYNTDTQENINTIRDSSPKESELSPEQPSSGPETSSQIWLAIAGIILLIGAGGIAWFTRKK